MAEKETSRNCQEFVDLITREMDFLFEDHGFNTSPIWADGSSARCLVIFESQDCRIRFIHEFGTIGADVGSADATPGWTSGSKGSREWYDLYTIVEFIQSQKPTLDEIRRHGVALQSMALEERLSDLTKSVRPVASKIFELFRRERLAKARSALEAYYSG